MGAVKKRSEKTTPRDLHVLIVGGSIAALTLANCLQHLNIAYTVLEAHSDLAPNVGASIVLMPSGARILEQLGMYDDICTVGEPILRTMIWDENGKRMIDTDGAELAHTRHGYPLAVLKRMDLLKVLAKHVTGDGVKTGKRVVRIEHSDDGVVAHCADGSVHHGDIIVGADGIHSTVRKSMFDHIETLYPGKTTKDRGAISAEYGCIFGLGDPVEGIETCRDSHRSYSTGRSTLTFVGHDGSLYWFLFVKLDRKYVGDEIPRFSEEEAEATARGFFHLTFNGTSTFKDIWEKKTMARMVPLEEAQFENWTEGRYVCLGDAIHKMTPNLGAGGNAAIESAAALANALAVLPRDNPSLDAIRATLQDFFKQRHRRANNICTAANKSTRDEAFATPLTRILIKLLLPGAGDATISKTCSVIVGGERLNFLPLPPRSSTATMPWDKNSGVGKREKKRHRFVWALPLMAMVYGCHLTMGVAMTRLSGTKGDGRMNMGNDVESGLWSQYFGLPKLDLFIELFVIFFTPAIGGFDPIGRLQMITFLADLVPLLIIWLIEANRRGNGATVASMMPTIMLQVCQIRGIGFLGPIYYFFHYVQSPLGNYAAADQRMVKIGRAKIIILTVFISYIIPSVAMFVAPELATRQWINGLFFQPFPLWAVLVQYILSKLVTDTTKTAKLSNPEADMPYLRQAYAFAAISSASVYLYVHAAAWQSSISALDVFFKDITKPNEMAPLLEGAGKVLRYDYLWSFGGGLFWVLLSFGDLKKAGKVQAGWATVIGLTMLATILAGPGAAMAVMWWWREEALAKHTRSEALKEE